MKQIIAFDGCDCIGKTTIIDNLITSLQNSGFNPFVFHLTGPSTEQNFINNLNDVGNISKAAIQYLKFYDLFKAIEVIISSNMNNIVILDRTPFSEFIWVKFFGRQNIASALTFNTNMFKEFKNICLNMLYISLDVDTEILANRILLKQSDRENFLAAFNRIYKEISANIDASTDTDLCKLLFMVQWVKNQYNSLETQLIKNNIMVKVFKNNTITQIDEIVSNIILVG